MRKRKVVVPISGNLIALTLIPVLERLRREPSIDLVCIDGGGGPLYHQVPFPLLSSSEVVPL